VNVAGSWLIGCGTALASLAMGYSITAWLAVRRRIHPAGGPTVECTSGHGTQATYAHRAVARRALSRDS
jgi:hypothetical protein